MPLLSPELLQLLGTLGTAAGAAFVGGKNSLNGFKLEMRSNLSQISASQAAIHETVVEVKGDVKELKVRDAWHDARISDLEVARRAQPLDTPEVKN